MSMALLAKGFLQGSQHSNFALVVAVAVLRKALTLASIPTYMCYSHIWRRLVCLTAI